MQVMEIKLKRWPITAALAQMSSVALSKNKQSRQAFPGQDTCAQEACKENTESLQFKGQNGKKWQGG